MIDPRFPPQPKKVIVPLYPTNGNLTNYLKYASLRHNSLSFVESWLSNKFDTSLNQIHLSSRGSSSLFLFLFWLQRSYDAPLKVAVPAFCCPDICFAILASGASPVFLDLLPDLSLSKESVLFASQEKCHVLIWPQLFGAQDLKNGLVQLIKTLGILLINDEAQSFPNSDYQPKKGDLSLFSFGHSKKLAAMGGGGICIHQKNLNNDFSKEITPIIKNPNKWIYHFKQTLMQRLIQFNRPFAEKFNFANKLEMNLPDLIEKNIAAFQTNAFDIASINTLQAFFVKQRIEKYNPLNHKNRSALLKNLVSEQWGSKTLSLIEGIAEPTIFALRISKNKRYELSTNLARHGVQTTWYYYPLNKLSFSKNFPSEKTSVSNKLSSEMLILPFQWRHSQKQFTHLVNAITSVKYANLALT